MSPQPTAPPADNKPAEAPVPHAALLKRIAEKVAKDEPLTTGEKQINRALGFERDRGDVMKKIAANRTYLRMLEENDELTDAEADWLDDFYPTKEKGEQRTDEEIERTRKAKAAARA